MADDKFKLDPEIEKIYLDKTLDSINDILPKLRCPISKKIFKYPVLASDSNIYEMIEIINVIKNDNKSPITGEELKQDITLVKPIKSFIDSLIEYFPHLKEHVYIYDKNIHYDFCENQDFFKLIFNGDTWKLIFNFYNFDLKILGKDFLTNLLKANNIKIEKHIIDNTTDLYVDISGLSLMHYVLQNKNDNIFNYLLSKNYNIFDNNFEGKHSYLSFACYYSTPTATKFFLEKNFNIFELYSSSHSYIIKGITQKQNYETNNLLLNKLKEDKNLKKFYEYGLDRSIGYFKENIIYNRNILKNDKNPLLKIWDTFYKPKKN